MEKAKKIGLRLLFPGPVWAMLFGITGGAGLAWVFGTGKEEAPVAYGIYVLAFYALCVICAEAVMIGWKLQKKKQQKTGPGPDEQEVLQQMKKTLYLAAAINLSYSIFKGGIAVVYHSVWFGAVAVYYMVLCVIHIFLLGTHHKRTCLEEETAQQLCEWRSYRNCGWMLLLLNLTMSGMVFQMIWQNKGYTYPGYVIYVLAGYTFYRIIVAIWRVLRRPRKQSPVLSAMHAVDLCIALMSVVALQTAMFASFGADMAEETRRLMNGLTGGIVCFVVVCIALCMILHASRTLRRLKETKEKENSSGGF